MTLILEILISLGAFTIITGLVQPWWVLWWTSKQNRILVLKYYGLPVIILSVFYLILRYYQ